MPDTRPGIKFNKDGICYPCISANKRKYIDWDSRLKQLSDLCDKYRRDDGYPDCLIPGSGGKDSLFQAHIMKSFGMNPLIVCVSDSYTHTKTGIDNLKNMSESTSSDLITFNLNHDTMRKMTRIAFEKLGIPNWPIDLAIYSIPLKLASKLNIPLIIYGENIAYEYGGPDSKETYSAKDQILNDVVKPLDINFWEKNGITKKDIEFISYPSEDIVDKLEPIYLSYFYEWSGKKNYEFGKQHGFKDCSQEWNRQGFIENYDQIDSIGYLLHPWLKYPKFGHSRVTDIACNWIREGYITRDKGVELVNKYEGTLDPKVLEDFCNTNHYTKKEFWDIVDKLWNRDLFKKVNGVWVLKEKVK
jgi:N-acetyl sugar amidotransferase